MECACCRECREMLNKHGQPTGRCIYGGPFSGYHLPDGTTEVLQK
jgi:hypothetical protein